MTVAKEPWEVTQKEWEREFSTTVEGHVGNFASKTPMFGEPVVVRGMRNPKGGKTFFVMNFGKLGQHYSTPEKAMAEAQRISINEALEQGKPVPAEVLKDYPELAAKYIVEAEGEVFTSPLGRRLPAGLNEVRKMASGFEVDVNGAVDFVVYGGSRSTRQVKEVTDAIERAGYKAYLVVAPKIVGLRGVADGTSRVFGIVKAVPLEWAKSEYVPIQAKSPRRKQKSHKRPSSPISVRGVRR